MVGFRVFIIHQNCHSDGIYSEVSEIILKKPECLRLYSLTESLIKLSQTTINSPTLWPSSVLITVYFLVGLIRVVRFRMWWNMCQELHTPELIAYYNIASYWKKYCCHHWKSEGVQNKESFKISFSRTTAPIRHQTCTVMVSQVNKDCNKFYRNGMIFFRNSPVCDVLLKCNFEYTFKSNYSLIETLNEYPGFFSSSLLGPG